MAFHLNVEVRFLVDRYHGSDWPPSPARLFQALVAGGKVGVPARHWSARHQAALEWLERLEPPEIFARPQRAGQPYTLFVPNNSLDAGQSTKTSKPVAPRLLTNHTAGDADLIYRWKVENSEAIGNHLPLLDDLASRLHTVGWGIDFAAAIALATDREDPPAGLEHFQPVGRGGTVLRLPCQGFLEHLGECHSAFAERITKEGINPSTRPTLFSEAHYQRAGSICYRRSIAFEMETLDGEPFAARWDQTQTVAAWLRHAAAEALVQEDLGQAWIDSFVLGHTAPAALGHRLSFVPLPSVGHPYSDGGIRRALVVEPPVTAPDTAALDLLRVKLSGWTLTDETRTPRAVLVPPNSAKKVLPFYLGTAKFWQSVTPVILHGHNAARGRISLAKTDRLLRQAFEAAGIPENVLASITFQQAPYWAGTEGAAAIRVPHHLVQWPRLHVRVEFSEPVRGPVLAGIGRHCGVGLFAGVASV